MRFEICAALTLLAGNILLREAPARMPDAAPVIVAPRVDSNQREAAKLEALWYANNAGYHRRTCDQDDPLAVLDADVDPAPGREHVIGNRRHGVAMYAEDGMLIARMEPVGCVDPAPGDQSLSLSSNGSRLIVHTRELRANGEHLTAHIVETREDKIARVLELDLGGEDITGALSFRDGEVEVRYHGRQRAADGGWEAVDDHCTWQLATRSSACRTRAATRTPRPE